MTITYRGIKEEALTYAELDENFRDLRQDTDLERVLINGNTSNLGITASEIKVNIALVAESNITEAIAAGNTWTNTSIDILNGLLQTMINTNALSANSYTVEVGTAGNNYTIEVATAGNNYTVEVAAAANSRTDTLISSTASSSNGYIVEVGTAGNNYMLTVGVAVGVGANLYSDNVGAASNNWSNTKLANTSTTVNGGLTMTDIHLISNVTVTLSTNVGNVGQVSWDGDYLYVCVATNQWKRTPLLAW
jgi:hypothetical protein